MQEHARFQEALLRRAAEGKLEARAVARVLAPPPSADGPGDVAALLDWLEGLGMPEAEVLADGLCPERCAEIRRLPADVVLPGLPPDAVRRFFADEGLTETLNAALTGQLDRIALDSRGVGGAAAAKLREQEAAWQAKLAANPAVWERILPPRALAELVLSDSGCWERWSTEEQERLGRFAAQLPGAAEPAARTAADWRFRLRGCTSRADARKLVDELCLWPTRELAEILPAVLEEPWQRRRAMQVLAWRFGRGDTDTWEGLNRWLGEQGERWRQIRGELATLQQARAGELLLLWSNGREDVPKDILELLRKPYAGVVAKNRLPGLRLRYAALLSAEDMAKLDYVVPTAVFAQPPAGAPPASVPVLRVKPQPAAIIPPRPATPTLWQQHLRPFLTENWLLVAGILGVLAGVSVLVYRYWQSTWLIRYTVVQGLLLAGTILPDRLGVWLEKRDAKLRDTAMTLTGATVLLVPLNVLCPIMLIGGEGGFGRLLAPLLGAGLLLGFGWWLQGVLGRSVPGFGRRFGLALSVMHGAGFGALLLMSLLGRESVPTILGILPYLLFAVCAVMVRTVPKTVASRQAKVFFGVTLAGTFGQLLTWGHLLAKAPFVGAIWAPLTVLIGGLGLLADCRFGEATEEERAIPGRIAFAGFAVVLLGLLLSLAHPWLRPLVFLLAGQIWLRYGLGRPHPAHAWIGISLTALGMLAIAYVPAWPVVWRPVVPLLAAIVLEPTFWRRRDHAFSGCLHEALAGVQSVFAGMAVVAAVLSQLHYRNVPWITLLIVGGATGLFAWFARRERNSRWVRAAAIVAVVALPYAGFADTQGNFWKANTMAFGLGLLAWLWIGLVQWRRQVECLRASRSTVLVLYGGFAMTAMSVRLLLQRLEPEAGLVWYWMDLMGPVLILGALVLATWWSRSLLPAGMAAVVGAIFAPAMKEFLIQVVPWIVWRSGLGSSLWALGLIGLCFRLRDEVRLRDLGPGDGWWETSRFPWIRTDHTLFTLPAFLTALFLCVRVDAYIWFWRLSHNLMVWRTCLALSLTGVAWLAAAVYLDRVNKSWQRWCAYLGCFWVGFGAALASWILRKEGWDDGALRFCLSVQTIHALGILVVAKHREWGRAVLVEPARWTLLVVSVGLTACLLMGMGLFAGLESMVWLALFCAVQLVWHGWWTRQHFFGWLLLGLLLVMAASAELGGNTGLVDVAGWHQVLRYPLATLILLLGLAVVAERWWVQVFSRGEALLMPLLLSGGGLAVAGGLGLVSQVLLPSEFDMVHFWLAAVFVLLAARANGWTFPVLCAVIAGGILAAAPGFPRDDFPALLAVVAEPWKLGLFACILVACAHGGAWVYRRWPKWLVSPQARYPLPSARPFVAAGVFVAFWGVLRHLRVTEHRDAAGQLAAPFLSALALLGAAVMPKAEQVVPLLASAWAFVVVGCVLAMRVCAGPWVRSLGGGEVHLLALGLAVAVLLAEAVAAGGRRRWPVRELRWLGAIPSALLVVLLILGYLSDPGLAKTNSARCLIAGVCVLVATFSFRRFRDERELNPLAASFPFSLALAVMALSMAIPWLRQADWALTALLLPAVSLLALAEWQKRPIEIEAAFWAICAPLPLLLVPQFYHLLCCPGTDLWVAHFHRHALVPLLAGLLMVRLAVRHRQAVAACFGGPLLALGCYAVVARWPLAWCFASVVLPRTVWLLVCAHLWLGLIASSAVRRRLIGELDGASVREFWQGFACAVSQFVVLGVVVYGGLSSYASAPLLVGAASVLIHAGAAGGPRWLTRVALAETVVAIHLDFLTPSYLPRNLVIWVLLACWAALLLADRWWKGRLRNQAAAGSQALVLLVFFHIWQRWPGSLAGLIGMVLGAGLYAWSPLPEKPKDERNGELAAILFLVPAWLAFWWSAGPTLKGLDSNMPRSLLAGALGLLAVAPLTVWQGTERLIRFWQGKRPVETRRIDHALAWMHRYAATADLAALVIASVVVLLTGLRRDTTPMHLGLGEVLCLGLVWGWWQTGKRLGDSVPVVLSMAAFFFGLLMVRNYLERKGLWVPEYDLWAGLGLSSLACALDRVFARQPDYARRPLATLHWGIPAVNTLWLLTHRLWGGDMALFLSALHSLQFGYLGRREKGSPYQAAAVFGAVVFCLLAFGTRLHLRQAYAYVVPIGFGTLALVHLFGERMQPADRNTVRSIALLAMLGSTVYYVIADSRLSLVHILVLGLLCLFCMGAAAFTRVRAYLYLGFTGFVVDLAALLYRVLIRLERGPRMTLVGVLVLGTGMALVAGSIYYKLNREQVRSRLGKLGERLGNWE